MPLLKYVSPWRPLTAWWQLCDCPYDFVSFPRLLVRDEDWRWLLCVSLGRCVPSPLAFYGATRPPWVGSGRAHMFGEHCCVPHPENQTLFHRKWVGCLIQKPSSWPHFKACLIYYCMDGMTELRIFIYSFSVILSVYIYKSNSLFSVDCS